MSVIWNDEKHSIGIVAIDEQHKALFVIVNEMFDVSGELIVSERQRKLIGLFKRLFAYAKFHFATEESLFKTHAYAAAAEHHNLHHNFGEKVKEWLDDAKLNPNFNIAMPLDYLVRWILFHIQDEDTKYAWDFQQKGINVEIHSAGPEIPAGTEMLALWQSRNLAIGVHELDRQHLELVHILQQVNDLSRHSLVRQKVILPEIIQKLFYYSQYHFSYEEELMSRAMWQGLSQHRELHKVFIKSVLDFSTAYNLRQWEGMTDTMILWLKDWALHHILVEDRHFTQTLR